MNKFFLKSKTIIGILISALPTLLPALGFSFSVDDAQMVSTTVDAVVQAGGLLLALYGRFVSDTKITIT